mgnify:CR=1 FL=1
MDYSDWVESNGRVWLHDDMTALAQFAYVNPIIRAFHWYNGSRKKCYKNDFESCFSCEKGVPSQLDYTYGVFTARKDQTIRYISTNLSTHNLIQRSFTQLFEENVNPCSILYEIHRGKVKTATGREVKGYNVASQIDMDSDVLIGSVSAFVEEVDRPSPFPDEATWVVPRAIADGLLNVDGHEFDLISLFLVMKDRFPSHSDSELKQFAIRLINNGTLDLRRAVENTWET